MYKQRIAVLPLISSKVLKSYWKQGAVYLNAFLDPELIFPVAKKTLKIKPNFKSKESKKTEKEKKKKPQKNRKSIKLINKNPKQNKIKKH